MSLSTLNMSVLVFIYIYTVKSFNFMGMKSSGLMTIDMFMDTSLKFMDFPIHNNTKLNVQRIKMISQYKQSH